MIIAESGSTKTDWVIITKNTRQHIKTIGINPFYLSSEEIADVFTSRITKHIDQDHHDLYFYGAGCSSEESKMKIKKALESTSSPIQCHVESDLLAAARSALQNKTGTVCILGTGSNCCAYNGNSIVSHIGGHGFILGDEGSGADLGKRLLQLHLFDQLPKEISLRIAQREEIFKRTYSEKRPNQYLASFSPLISEFKKTPEIKKLISESFESFIKYHLKNVQGPIHFVGSIANIYKHELQEAFLRNELQLGSIIKSPIEALTKYHLNESEI